MRVNMHTRGRALYNLLRMNWLENKSIQVQPWQVEDYRVKKEDVLFKNLQDLGIVLDKATFLAYVENTDSPEEMADCLWVKEESPEIFDKIYLIIFELWRRLASEKQTISIFCDELDYLIDLYDHGRLDEDDKIHAALSELQRVLEKNSQEMKPSQVFAFVSDYCAHDIESFLYDYISGLIHSSHEIYASELIDGFVDYVQDRRWFDLLKGQVMLHSTPNEAKRFLKRLYEDVKEDPDLDLLLELACVFVHFAEEDAFFDLVRNAVRLLRNEEDFQDLLAIVSDFYSCMGNSAQEKQLQELFKKRAGKDLEQPLNVQDRDWKLFLETIGAS